MSESWDGRERLIAGRFLLLRELGRGGMGTVWLAADETLGRQVAIKELRPPRGLAGADLEAQRQRALREARSAARIQHSNAVILYEVFPAGAGDEAAYLIMEFVEGPTLGQLIAREGPRPAARVANYGLQLLDVLEAAHALGIVHRDVKPGNILIAAGDQVKLADFGIAHTAGTAGLARGEFVGTYAYMAPELFDHAPVTPAADLWSLGATLYVAVEGRGPFDGESTAAVLDAIRVADLPVPHCEPHLAAAIQGLLRRGPRERASAAEARVHLEQVPGMRSRTGPSPRPHRRWDPDAPTGRHTDGWPTVPPVPTPPPTDTDRARRGRARWAAVAGVVLLAAAGTVAAVLATRSSPPSPIIIDSRGSTTTADSATANRGPTGKASTVSSGPATAVSSATTRPSSASPPATVPQTTAPAVAPASVGSAATSPCATHDLTATLGPYNPNAGNIDQVIDFTNVSGAPCSLYGFPGVALTTGMRPSAQVGAAADRTSSAPSLVTLASGGTANAQLKIVDAGNYPTCSPVATSYLQIYLPGQTAATYLPFTSTGCRSAAAQLLFISVVQQGAGTAGV